MNILDNIKQHKLEETAYRKPLYPTKLLEKSIFFESPCVSLKSYVADPKRKGIIAEFKRKSTSKGIINDYADVMQTTLGYMQAGASALSVLTDDTYFMGKSEDLIVARNANYCPILRKDFTVDEYQIIEAKSIGADAVLLIAAALEKDRIKTLYQLAKSLGLEVLFEIHEKTELDKLPDSDLIIGVNNRNLKTMDVDLKTSFDIISELPKTSLLISESGLSNVEDVKQLKEAGYQGFLMGEHFMRTPNPAEALKQFIAKLNAL